MSLERALITAEALSRLAIARSSELDDVTLKVYLDALEDLEPQIVSRACADLAKVPRAEFESALPSVGTIRERCAEFVRLDQVAAANAKLLALPVRADADGPRFFCLDCLDTSWRLLSCAGKGGQARLDFVSDLLRFPCGRLKSHGPHSYSERCKCVETNPVIAEDRRREREAKQKRESRAAARS